MYTKDQIAEAWESLEKRYEGALGFLHFETFYRILEGIGKREQRRANGHASNRVSGNASHKVPAKTHKAA